MRDNVLTLNLMNDFSFFRENILEIWGKYNFIFCSVISHILDPRNFYIEYIRGYIGKRKFIFQVANMNLIYWSVSSSSWRGGDEVKGGMRGIVVLASL